MPLVRLGPCRGGAPGERGLTSVADGPSLDAVVRGALEAAWAVARSGERSSPPLPAPRSLRPLLGHARLTAAALATIRKALDEDDEFRARVAEAVDEQAVGRAGWLFLARPDGWETEVAGLVEASASVAAAAEEGRAERSATRRLKGTEEALRRAEEALAGERAHGARLADELARERAARRAAEDAVERLRVESDALGERLAASEAQRADARPGPPDADARVAADERMLTEPRLVEVEVPVVPAEVVDLVGRAAEAAREAQERLADAVAALVRETSHAPPTAPDTTPTGDDGQPIGHRHATRPGPPRARRRPAPLPPAVFEDSVEAADHLVRRPGAVLLVDGYNASMGYRPDLPIGELRRRLVDAVDELVARTGVDAQIVFDGAETTDPGPLTRTGGRRLAARVAFSPPDVEADDVILGLVDGAPLNRPVIVASDDRRVQDGARLRGANVISTGQLLAVLRRER